ncbi:MAG: hypothetical protein C5B59_10545 [Bacteroidetes bacterium]|nr:MAG: hypothetical protein C5B59_10545 [Bacteroidota bacterium]
MIPKNLSFKRTLIVATTILFSHLSALSQSKAESSSAKKEDYDVHKFKTVYVELSTEPISFKISRINSIAIIDSRPDTSEIGLIRRGLNEPSFIKLRQGTKTVMTNILNHSVSPIQQDSLNKLVIVLKKLWLTDALHRLEEKDWEGNIYIDHDTNYAAILSTMEFYYNQNDDYYPLYRFDTTIVKSGKIMKLGGQLINEVLEASLARFEKFAETGRSFNANTRKLSWNDIHSYNDQRFNLPILTDTTLHKGVYQSFDEFKSNNPSTRDFEVSKDKLTDLIYIRDVDGTLTPARNAWGYCDGTHLFIRLRDNFFLLQKIRNAFYIYGAQKVIYTKDVFGSTAPTYQNGVMSPGYGTTNRTIARELQLRPFVLDWDTGKLE